MDSHLSTTSARKPGEPGISLELSSVPPPAPPILDLGGQIGAADIGRGMSPARSLSPGLQIQNKLGSNAPSTSGQGSLYSAPPLFTGKPTPSAPPQSSTPPAPATTSTSQPTASTSAPSQGLMRPPPPKPRPPLPPRPPTAPQASAVLALAAATRTPAVAVPPSAPPGTTPPAPLQPSAPAPNPSPTATTAPSTSPAAAPTSSPQQPVLAGNVLTMSSTLNLVKHVLLIQQIRDLVQALMRMDIPGMAGLATAVGQQVKKKMMQRADAAAEEGRALDRPLDALQIQALRVVLKTIEGVVFYEHEGEPTPAGCEAVAALRGCVFGQDDAPGADGMGVMSTRSLEKLRAFHYACASLVRRCVRPGNCLRLLRLARAVDLSDLEEYVHLYCISNLAAALQSPNGGDDWARLEAEDVETLLSNSNVQFSEMDVWSAVLTWVSYDAPVRQGWLPDLLDSCVRLDDMDTLALQQLGRVPLVSSCPEAAALVSSAYMRRMVCSVHQSRGEAAEHDGSSGGQRPVERSGGRPDMGGLRIETASLLSPTGLVSDISPDEERLLKRAKVSAQSMGGGMSGVQAAVERLQQGAQDSWHQHGHTPMHLS